MYKFVVLAATLAYASAGIIAHAPVVHSAVPVLATGHEYHRSVQSQTIVDPPQVKTVYETAPVVHSAHLVHAAPVVHTHHVVPVVKSAPLVAVSAPEVHKTVQATSIVHGPSTVLHAVPAVHHAVPVVYSAPVVHAHSAQFVHAH